jgi:hypothetical protein
MKSCRVPKRKTWRDFCVATKSGNDRHQVGQRPSEEGTGSTKFDFKAQLLTGVVTTLLTLIATVVGIAINEHLQQHHWDQEKHYTIESDLLSRRFALLDRFLKVSRRDAELSTLKFLVQYNVDQVGNAAKQKDAVASYKLIRDGADETRRLDDGRAEYLAVLTLSAAIFGPKTQRAVHAIIAKHNPNVWEADEEEKSAMVEAMSSELGWGLPDVPVNTDKSFTASPSS